MITNPKPSFTRRWLLPLVAGTCATGLVWWLLLPGVPRPSWTFETDADFPYDFPQGGGSRLVLRRKLPDVHEFFELDTNAGQQRPLGRLPPAPQLKAFLGFVPCKPHLIYVSEDEDKLRDVGVRVVNIASGQTLLHWQEGLPVGFGPKLVVHAIRSKDGSWEQHVRIVDPESGRVEHEVLLPETESGWIWPSATFSSDGELVALSRVRLEQLPEFKTAVISLRNGRLLYEQRGVVMLKTGIL